MIPSKQARQPRHRSSDAEFARLQRRLRLALGALVLVTVVGVLGFVIIARGEHGVIDAARINANLERATGVPPSPPGQSS